MAVEAAKIVIPITTNANQANASLTQTNDILLKMEKRLNGVEKESRQTANSFKGFSKVGSWLASAGIAYFAVEAGKKLAKVASDAEETENKFNVTFSGISEKAKQTAQTLADSFGLSGQEAQKMLSDTGDLLTGFGFAQDEALGLSDRLNRLAVDLASFTNIEGGSERASKALTSALFGEREAAKSLGIVIREDDIAQRLAAKGMDKLTGTSLLQAKAQETLNIAYEQSLNAIGDFERSQDSAANVLRRVQARVSDMAASAGGPLRDALRNLGLAFLDASKAGGFLDTVLKSVVDGVAKLINLIALATAKFNEFSNSSKIADQNEELTKMNAKYTDAVVKLREMGYSMKEIGQMAKEANKTSTVAYKNIKGEAMARGQLLSASARLESSSTKLNGLYASEADTQRTINKILNTHSQNINNKTAAQARFNSEASGSKQIFEDALKAASSAGDIGAQLKLLGMQYQENVKTVQAAGMQTTSLEQFYAKQRLTTIQQYYKAVADNDTLSYEAKMARLNENNALLLETENITYEERLMAQQAFTDASNAIEQTRFAAVNKSAQMYGQFATVSIGLAEKVAQFRTNMNQKEIDSLKAKGATEEEIQKKQRELARDQAKQQKVFGIFQAIINTALGVTNALATMPPPASFVMAALTAAMGIAEIAVIASTPLPAAAFGGNFTVPMGNEADGGLLRVSSGEDVSVTPSRKSENTSSGFPNQIVVKIGDRDFNAFMTDSMNKNLNNGKVQIRRKGVVKTA